MSARRRKRPTRREREARKKLHTHRLHFFAEVDGDGNVVSTYVSTMENPVEGAKLADRLVELTKAEDIRDLQHQPERLRIDRRTNTVERKPNVRLSVDTRVIKADGSDVARIMVIPAQEQWPWLVLAINGQRVQIAPRQILTVGATSTIGQKYRIVLRDPRVYCEQPVKRVVSIDPAIDLHPIPDPGE